MAGTLRGLRNWEMQRDEAGHREYKALWLVKVDDKDDGPAIVLQTPGLPLPGSIWVFGNDVDLWAWCRPNALIKPHEHEEGDPHLWWTVEQTFSTTPLPLSIQRCQDTPIEDPLLEPPKVSGSFIKFQEEAQFDKDGLSIHTSSWEQLRGNQVEFDKNRPSVSIEQNVATQYEAVTLPAIYMDYVNDSEMWGLPARTVKLSNATWSKQYHGQCQTYYTRTLEFEINYSTFDRALLDEGTKVLQGHWGTGKGKGAAVRILSVDGNGAILTIQAGAEGNGYEPNCTVGLKVKQINGSGGIVLGKTDTNGKVVEMTLYRGGRNYFEDITAADTVIGQGWVLDNVKDQNDPPTYSTPNRNNPAHFKRFTDKDGNAASVILDGRGIPIGGFTGDESDVGSVIVRKYYQANLFLLGIPAVL